MTVERQRLGIIIQVVAHGPRLFAWAMRADQAAPFMRSRGYFLDAKQAEADARGVIQRNGKKVAYVESVNAQV